MVAMSLHRLGSGDGLQNIQSQLSHSLLVKKN